MIEQPIRWGQWPALSELCEQSPIPIALDEELIGLQSQAEKRALLTTIQPDYLVLKPTLLGGFSAAEAWISLAEAHNVGWLINSALESRIGLNALAQWTSQIGDHRVHGLGTGELYTNNFQAPLHLSGAGLKLEYGLPWNIDGLAFYD